MSEEFYVCGGLRIKSDMVLPTLQSVEPGAFDIRVLRGEGSGPVTPPVAYPPEHRMCFSVEGVAEFEVVRATHISVWPVAAADANMVAAAVGNSALVAMFYQMGMAPLHVSSVAEGDAAWAFAGSPGAGKSTLTTWLTSMLDFELVADDLAVVAADNRPVTILPGLRRIRLGRDVIDSFGLIDRFTATGGPRNKFVNASGRLVPSRNYDFKGLVLLDTIDHGGPEFTRVSGAPALPLFMSSLYSVELGAKIIGLAGLFALAGRICASVPVYRYARRLDLGAMSRDTQILAGQLRAEK